MRNEQEHIKYLCALWWNNRSSVTIHPEALALIRSPNPDKTIYIEFAGIQEHGVYQSGRLPIFGKGSQFKGWEPYAEDILKLLFILSKNNFYVSR